MRFNGQPLVSHGMQYGAFAKHRARVRCDVWIRMVTGTEGEIGGWGEVCAVPLIFLRFVTVRRTRRYGCNIHVD